MDEQTVLDFLRCHIAFFAINLSCSDSSLLSVVILNTENSFIILIMPGEIMPSTHLIGLVDPLS